MDCFLEEANEQLDAIETVLNSFDQEGGLGGLKERVFIPLHTLKAGSSLAGLDVLSDLVHLGESQLCELYSQDLMTARDAADSLRDICVQIRLALEKVESGHTCSERLRNRLRLYVQDLGSRMGKQVELGLEQMDDRVLVHLHHSFLGSLAHLLRNAMCHGIETPPQRRQEGKVGVGSVSIRTHRQGANVLIEVADDGRGIDGDAIVGHAIRQGILSAEEAALLQENEKIDLVWRAGFSTGLEVTSLCGRGFGLDAVRASVEKYGGRVQMASQRSRGTTVRLQIPLSAIDLPA